MAILNQPSAMQAPGTEQTPGTESTLGTVEPEPNVSPEEQSQYDDLVTYALQHLYGDGRDQIIERIKRQSSDPAQAIGRAVAILGDSVVAKAREAGEVIDDGVLMNAAAEIVSVVAEMAEAAGAVESVTDEVLEQALYHAMKSYGSQLLDSGEQPAEDQQAIEQGLAELGVQAPQGAPQGQQPIQPPQPPQQPMQGLLQGSGGV